MSCALPEPGDNIPAHLADTPEANLCADLANGLHAMAQPLTVLRAAMGALILREQIEPANRRYYEMSAQQVERLCDLMSGVQSLLDLHQSAPACDILDLWSLVGPIVDEQRIALQKLNLQIEASTPDRLWQIVADPSKTEQAVRAALLAAAALSVPNGTIEVEILTHNRSARLAVRCRESKRSPDSSDRLRLSIADVGMRSQGGLFTISEAPFCISLSFPLKSQDDLHPERAAHDAPMVPAG